MVAFPAPVSHGTKGVAHRSMGTYAVAYRNCEAVPMKNITVSVDTDTRRPVRIRTTVLPALENVHGWLNKLLILLRVIFEERLFSPKWFDKSLIFLTFSLRPPLCITKWSGKSLIFLCIIQYNYVLI